MSLTDILPWTPVAFQALVMILTLGSLVIDRSIRPSLIPRAEIEALADELMRRQPDDPEGAAFAAECAAWYRSENFEEGKWRRVRRAVRRRLRQAATRSDA
jgi:hypothetical protein